MTAPLSNDLRIRVVTAIDAGLSRRQAAVHFGVSIASAVRWYQRFKRTGGVAPDAMGGDKRSHVIEAHGDAVAGWLDEAPDLTLPELQERLDDGGHWFSQSAIGRLLKRHGLTRKKRPPMPPNRSAKT